MAGADLFGWQEVKAAEAAVAAAHAVQEEARRKVRCAPHGLKREREQALQAATRAALEAETILRAVYVEEGL